jgi:Nucleoside-diphosphate-sugar pyrophosphorylase involved in lipopolysaccharide biosynthesis/translation initiation factor 2B, gamma/epsilon subunits (eIF-2Bgamma/eIF-2Bepsilon)
MRAMILAAGFGKRLLPITERLKLANTVYNDQN